ncbi:MAG TPA: hypothetical protein VGQ32_01750 [Thermoanaerobaculia bacterium]|jgi:hypothetical protein|nr:hypothetical protein [Thermoanaerobaculia bacterium]
MSAEVIPKPGAMPEADSDFSVVYGGPMMRLMARIGFENPRRRAIGIVLITWGGLLVLSALTALLRGGGEVKLFLTDLSALVRFVVAAPILVLAEEKIHRFTSQSARQFVSAGFVREADLPRYRRALEEVSRGRESKLAEGVLVVLAYAAAWIWFRNELRDGTAGWHARSDATGIHFLPAGIWYVFMSIPFYQFLIYRWIYRMILWIRFLWRMSRMDLVLYPTHPDQAGGLGFLAGTQSSFAPIVFATAAVTSAIQFERIRGGLTTFDSIQWVLLVLVVVVYPLLLLGPLVVFYLPLARARRQAELQYGALATRYIRLFNERWGTSRGSDEELLGSSDIQSLADLQNSLSATQRMRLIPVTRNAAKSLLLAGALPFAPLLLTKIPPKELLNMLFKVAA